MTCEPWDVVAVPFPFTERLGEKKRPALVLSKKAFNRAGHTVLAMVTSTAHRRWPGDVDLAHWKATGLRTACLVRLKLFTLDNRLLMRRIGSLSPADRRVVGQSLRRHLE